MRHRVLDAPGDTKRALRCHKVLAARCGLLHSVADCQKPSVTKCQLHNLIVGLMHGVSKSPPNGMAWCLRHNGEYYILLGV